MTAIKVLARIAGSREYLPLFDDDEQPAQSVKVEVEGLVVTILTRPNRLSDHREVDIRIDPINGDAVGIEHEETTIGRTQVHLKLIADNSGRGITV